MTFHSVIINSVPANRRLPLLADDDPYRWVESDYDAGVELASAAHRVLVYAHRLDRSPPRGLSEPMILFARAVARWHPGRFHPAVAWAKRSPAAPKPRVTKRASPRPEPTRQHFAMAPGYYHIVLVDGVLRCVSSDGTVHGTYAP